MHAWDPYKEYKRSDQGEKKKKTQQYMHKHQKIRYSSTKGYEKLQQNTYNR